MEKRRMLERKTIKQLLLSPFRQFLLFSSFFIIIISPSFAESENPDLQKGKKELQGLRTEIKEKKKGLAEAGKKEKGLISEIEKINRKVDSLEAEERRLDRKIIILEKGLQEKTTAISALRLETERKKRLLYKRLVFLYKSGDSGYLRFLLSSENLSDPGRKYRYMTRVAAHDKDLIKGYKRDATELSMQMEEILTDKKRLEGAEKELAKKRVEIKKERGERDRLLAEVRKEKSQYKESLKELEANAKSLQQLLKKLERQAATHARSTPPKSSTADDIRSYPTSGFEHQKGLLDFPVKGEVIGFFGKELDKNSKTAVLRKGIEIRAKGGSQVKAVYNGRVIFADQFKGFGLLIIVDHGGGYYTLYAHTARLLKKVNDEINKGDIIAEVGESGPDSEPSLYFEVRHGGKPENPLNWLKS